MRALVDDDPAQSPVARALLAHPCIVTATVILETEWVLRSVYRWQRAIIADALSTIISLPNAAIIPPEIDWAVSRYRDRGDFADLMHLAVSRGAVSFATFDTSVADQAGPTSPVPVETLR